MKRFPKRAKAVKTFKTEAEIKKTIRDDILRILQEDLEVTIDENLENILRAIKAGFTLNVRIVSVAPATDEQAASASPEQLTPVPKIEIVPR